MREHPELGVYVDKLTKHIVTDCGEVYGLIEKGKKNRSVTHNIGLHIRQCFSKLCSVQSQGRYSHTLAIHVCAAGKVMVFKPFGLV